MVKLQPHIKCKKGDVADWVLLPGDPKRIDAIIEQLDSSREVMYNREYRTCTGKYKNTDVSVTSTGIGCPSTAIAIEELAKIGVKGFIRVGTCGGLLKGMKSGDLVIPIAATKTDGTTREYEPLGDFAYPDKEVVNALKEAAEKMKVKFFTGVNRTHDAFYESTKSFLKLADLKIKDLVSSEMECSAVFFVSKLRGAKSGAILVVNTPEPLEEVAKNSSRIYELTDIKKVREGVDNAIKIALESIKILKKKQKLNKRDEDT